MVVFETQNHILGKTIVEFFPCHLQDDSRPHPRPGEEEEMKLLSAVFDTLLLPVEVVKDIFTAPVRVLSDGKKSYTREKIEQIEEELNL